MQKKITYTLNQEEIVDAIALYLSDKLEEYIEPKEDYQQGIIINFPRDGCEAAIKEYCAEALEITSIVFRKDKDGHSVQAIAVEEMNKPEGDIVKDIVDSGVFDLDFPAIGGLG